MPRIAAGFEQADQQVQVAVLTTEPAFELNGAILSSAERGSDLFDELRKDCIERVLPLDGKFKLPFYRDLRQRAMRRDNLGLVAQRLIDALDQRLPKPRGETLARQAQQLPDLQNAQFAQQLNGQRRQT